MPDQLTPLARISAAIEKLGGMGVPPVSFFAIDVVMRSAGVIDFILRSLHIAQHEAESGRTPDPRVVALADAVLGGES